MSGKARRRRNRAGEEVALTPERPRRGDVERLERAIADEAGQPARPYLAVDALLVMERRGTITAAMRQAGEDFRAMFFLARLDPLCAPALARVRVGAQEVPLSERQIQAREKIWQALKTLGGIASPAGSCVWHVVGCEWSVKDWALREGWGGRRLGQETASGILVGALGVLQALYGL